jgi:tol-pal system protein YbgF
MSQDLAQLRGRIDSLANQLDTEDKRFHDLYVDLDSRLKAVESVLPKPEGADGSTSGSAGVGSGKEGAPPPVGMAEGGKSVATVADNGAKSVGQGKGENPEGVSDAKAPSADYDAALSVFNAGNYVKSRKLFEAFVKANPNDDKVPNALYWIGMNQLLLKDYKGARATNQHLYKSYPDSPKTADGLLNLAAAWLGLGEPATAKATWKMIIAEYPGSSAAQKAKARLRQH